MSTPSSLSITDTDFALKRNPSLKAPRSSRLLLVHEMRLQGLTVEYEVRLSLSQPYASIWQSVWTGGDKSAAAGRLFRVSGWQSDEAQIRELARTLVRARWPFEVAGPLLESGLITGTVWQRELDVFDAMHDASARDAQQAHEETPSPLIACAKSLRLNPQPSGEAPHQWTASCPRGNHPIFISTRSETFGCPWCRRKGGVEVLTAFAAEHGIVPRPVEAMPTNELRRHTSFESPSIAWDFRPADYMRAHPKGSERVRGSMPGLFGIGPQRLGGKFLPMRLRDEVEIARVRLRSVTWDVTAIYASGSVDQYRYRVVDEYSGDTLRGVASRTSSYPLTLAELVDFLLETWPLVKVLSNHRRRPERSDATRAYRASSSFYPEFADALKSKLNFSSKKAAHRTKQDQAETPRWPLSRGQNSPGARPKLTGSVWISVPDPREHPIDLNCQLAKIWQHGLWISGCFEALYRAIRQCGHVHVAQLPNVVGDPSHDFFRPPHASSRDALD